MLPVATGGDICCVLKRSSDGWMRPSVRGPHLRAVVNILLPQVSDFIPVVRQLTIECRLRSISASCRCKWEEAYAHVQGPRCGRGQAAVGENVSRPGLRSR